MQFSIQALQSSCLMSHRNKAFQSLALEQGFPHKDNSTRLGN